jgi:hypothetical protein
MFFTLWEIGEKILAEERMTSYEEEDEYPGGEEYGSLPKFQQFEGTGTSDPFFWNMHFFIVVVP